MIVFKTTMGEMPKTCLDCQMECTLPVGLRDYTKVLKPYRTKRHPQCPLMELFDETHQEETGHVSRP